MSIESDGALTVPDFAGNRFFATLGNILINGRAGLMFVDFDDGTLLQMTVHAELLDADAHVAPFLGAERFSRFRPDLVIRQRRAIPFLFTFEEWSPKLLATGTWKQSKPPEPLTEPDGG